MRLTTIKKTLQLTFIGLVVGVQLNAQEFDYLPFLEGDVLIEHTYYTLSYSEQHEQPKWVAYALRPEMLHKVVERKNDFREDPNVETGSSTYEDYEAAPDYDAGHMLCSRNMQFSCESMSETFYMSNMSPQHKELNRKRWAQLEHLERSMVERNGTLYVVCGPVLTDIQKTIGVDNQISVPNYYFKVLLKHDGASAKCIAFLMPNELCEEPLESYVVSIDQVEEMTGIDFFPELGDELENAIEELSNKELWEFTKTRSNYGYEEEAVKCTTSN